MRHGLLLVIGVMGFLVSCQKGPSPAGPGAGPIAGPPEAETARAAPDWPGPVQREWLVGIWLRPAEGGNQARVLALYPDGAWAAAYLAGKPEAEVRLEHLSTGNRPWRLADPSDLVNPAPVLLLPDERPDGGLSYHGGDYVVAVSPERLVLFNPNGRGIVMPPQEYTRTTGEVQERLDRAVAPALRRAPLAKALAAAPFAAWPPRLARERLVGTWLMDAGLSNGQPTHYLLIVGGDGSWLTANLTGDALAPTRVEVVESSPPGWELAPLGFAVGPTLHASRAVAGGGTGSALALQINQVRGDALVANDRCTYERVTGAREENLLAMVAEARRGRR